MGIIISKQYQYITMNDVGKHYTICDEIEIVDGRIPVHTTKKRLKHIYVVHKVRTFECVTLDHSYNCEPPWRKIEHWYIVDKRQ